MKNKFKILFFLVLVVALTFSGCADNAVIESGCIGGYTYGFWGGLWHGITSPFRFFGELIWGDVPMYALNNNGSWYSFGFLLGSGGWGIMASRIK